MKITLWRSIAAALAASATLAVPASAATSTTTTTSVPAGCPTNVVKVPQATKWTGTASSTTWDATGTSYLQTSNNLLPMNVNGGGGCLVNAKVAGNFSTSTRWW